MDELLAERELGEPRIRVNRGLPFGESERVERTAHRLELQYALRPRWQPLRKGNVQ